MLRNAALSVALVAFNSFYTHIEFPLIYFIIDFRSYQIHMLNFLQILTSTLFD